MQANTLGEWPSKQAPLPADWRKQDSDDIEVGLIECHSLSPDEAECLRGPEQREFTAKAR